MPELIGWLAGLAGGVWLLSWALWPGQRRVRVKKVDWRP